MTEKQLLEKTTKYLKTFNHVFYERRVPYGLNYKKGIPDLYFVAKGKHYEIEFKSPELKKIIHKPEQVLWIKRFNETYGAKAIISNSWEEIKKFIDENI